MKSTDNKKAQHLQATGLIDVNLKEINMTSNSLTQITVPFHSAELYLVEHNGQPYTPMKPIVEGMGLDWKSQFAKIKDKFNSSMVEITIQVVGDLQSRPYLCLPVRKLAAWLYSISPNKVKPEIRDSVIMYQNECDDVLWDYWTKGQAVNPRSFAKTHKSEREPLTNAVNLLVAKTKHLNYSDAYKLVHQRFNVQHIDEIAFDAIPIAVEYVHHLIALYSSAGKQGSLFDKDIYELIREFTESVLSQNFMMQDVWKALMLINKGDMMYYSKYILDSNELARKVSIELDFKTRKGVPLVSPDLKQINFHSGTIFGVNPKWFNAPAW